MRSFDNVLDNEKEKVMQFLSGRNIDRYFVDNEQSTVLSMRPGYGRKENGRYRIPPEMLKAMKKSKSMWRRFVRWLSFFPRIFDIHDHFGLVQPASFSWCGGKLNLYRSMR